MFTKLFNVIVIEQRLTCLSASQTWALVLFTWSLPARICMRYHINLIFKMYIKFEINKNTF